MSFTFSTIGAGLGTVGSVACTVVYNGELYAGGTFTIAGGAPSNSIAKWNGTSWVAMGDFTAGRQVKSLAVYGGELYVGGNFNGGSGISGANHLIKYNGTSWGVVGNPYDVPNYVTALAVIGGVLYIGGVFTLIASVTGTNGLAKWNGSSFTAVDATTDFGGDSIYAICEYNSDIYVCGSFTNCCGVTGANRIAKWNGSTWGLVGAASDINNLVVTMAVYGGNLYIGGYFTSAGGVPNTNKIAKWNGTSWGAVGYVDNTVFSLMVADSNLYVGGLFTERLLTWNGTTFSTVTGAPVDNSIKAMTYSSPSKLYLGGDFTGLVYEGLVPDTTAPTPGSSGTITTASVLDTSLTLNWTKATDDTDVQASLQYLAYRSLSSNLDSVSEIEAGTAIGTYTADINTKSVTGLTAKTTYYFNVIVKDTAGNKAAYAKKMQATADLSTPVPGSSGTLTPSIVTATSLSLTWAKASDVDDAQASLQYLVYYSTSTMGSTPWTGTAVGSYAADIDTKAVTGLSASTPYYFNVVVKDAAENRAIYSELPQSTTGLIPTNVTGPVTVANTGGTITLTEDMTVTASGELTLDVAEIGDLLGGKVITVQPGGKITLAAGKQITVLAGTLYALHV